MQRRLGARMELLIAEEILDGRAHTIDIDELRITRFAIERLHHELNIV